MKKSFLSTMKICLMLLVALVFTLSLYACTKEETAAPTESPSAEPPAIATFKPVVEIDYDKEEFTIVETTIVEYIGKGGDVVIPEKVTAIGDMAFSGRSDVTSVTFTKDVVSIGEKAFENCTGLGEGFIPAGLTAVDKPTADGANAYASYINADGTAGLMITVTSLGGKLYDMVATGVNLQ